MRQTLDAAGIRLTKSLGQNFLHDAHQLKRIVELAELQAADKVLEIGPGLGPLTRVIVQTAGTVLAIEKDRRFVELLQREFANVKRLTLLHADALDYLRGEPRDWSGWKLVSNLPYSVGSALLVELALAERPPPQCVVTLQAEVVHRLLSDAGKPDCGLLTLLVGQRYAPAGWFKIPAACFFPEPEVDSACVRLNERRPALLSATERGTFVRVVKRAFSQRRKMMLKLLKQDWPSDRLADAFKAAALPETTRAEAVGLEGFVTLAKALHTASALS